MCVNLNLKNMEKLVTRFVAVCLVLSCIAGGAMAQGKTTPMPKDHVMLKTSELKWMEGPASLPPGAKVAALEGDMTKAGPFTVRVIFPANYKIMPHFHSAIEHITVLEGEFYMGHGDNFNEATSSKMDVGGFAVMPAKFHHYAYTKDRQTVIQLHGMGPFDITYIDVANDPRKAKKK